MEKAGGGKFVAKKKKQQRNIKAGRSKEKCFSLFFLLKRKGF